ncbi:MAG: hypothetical protein WC635_14870 [Bacteriovorax sp.]|jgi:hypothetical protein
MKPNIKFLSASLFMIFSVNSFALVDYSEPVAENKKNEGPLNKTSARMEPTRSESRSLIWKSDFSFTANYEAREIEAEKIGVINLNTHLQTPFNVYFDISYWNAQNKAGSQSGNPKGIIGFNWLRLGSPSEEARFDIFGGGKFAGSSELASSRTDKIFGLETTKRFGTFGLGLGFDMTMTGAPKKDTDMSIGNIQRITVSGGWMVSNDIQFEVEAENFKINASDDTSRLNRLQKSVSFSALSPKLNLSLAPGIGMEMGAHFRTNKPKTDQNLASAKLFDLHGAYSNSLFAGLNLSL